ncbi:MAG: BTAD domain-containing putative transcriptional regulator [Betaproteobacteria bacterium]
MTFARHSKNDVGSELPEDYRLALEASHRGEPRAIEGLNTALADCLTRGDAVGAALASAALLLSGQVMGNYRRFPEHIARLAIVRDPEFVWPGRDQELVALAGLLAGLIYFGSADPFLETCVERIMGLLDLDLDVNVRFAAGRLVLFYTEPRELRALGQRTYSLLRPSMERSDLSPHRLGHWLIFWSRCAQHSMEPQQADLARQQARKLAENLHLRDILVRLAFMDVERRLMERKVVPAEQALAAAESVMDPGSIGEMPRLLFMRTKLALLKGNGDGAVFHASRGTKYSIELEHPPPMRAVYIVNEAQARLFNNEFAAARELMLQAVELVPGNYVDEIHDMITLVDAYEAIIGKRSNGHVLMANAWAGMRERQFYDTFEGYPEFCAKLCVLALEHDIETEFVQRLIELRGIAPPSNAPESWPWPIRVYALGGFKVYLRGDELAFAGKAQKKPMELLKVLVALGGRGIAKEKLYDVLWADADPAAAAAALDVVVSRLRKLLGNSDAIRIDEGKVGLDADRVWLDVWAFDRDVESLQGLLRGPPDDGRIDELGRSLLGRYLGPFLGSEDPQRWSLAARDRWQNRFRRSLADVGGYWEQRGDWSRAIALYERAIEEDGLAENLYRHLMRGHLARGEPAEAARVYRRCREMLSVQLGIPPSPSTEALFQSIYRN